MQLQNTTKIIYLIFTLFVILIFIFLLRWQFFDTAYWSQKATQRIQTKYEEGMRGKIMSSDGSILAYSENAYDLHIYKPTLEELQNKDKYGKYSQDIDDVLLKVANVLNVLPQDLRKIYDNPDIKDVLLAKNISQEIKDRLLLIQTNKSTQDRSIYVRGLEFVKNQKRVYPENELASHLIGYLGKDISGKNIPSGGIEYSENGVLSPILGYKVQEFDANGQPISLGSSDSLSAKNGKDIRLTMKRGIQQKLQEKIDQGVSKYNAEHVIGIIMNPKTGDILASAVSPSFDLNKYYDIKSNEVLNNKIFSEPYEPGSVGKSFTFAATFNEGQIEKDTYLLASHNGCYKDIICVANKVSRKDLTVTKTLETSDNIGTYLIADMLGQEKLKEYLNKFGIGKLLNTGFQEESNGTINKEYWSKKDIATNAIGQSYSMTPLQLISAYSTFANNGIRVYPRFIDSTIDGKDIIKFPSKIEDKIIEPNAVQKINEILEVTFQKTLKNNYLADKNIYDSLSKMHIAAKTGTAQIVNPVTKRYFDTNTYNTTVVGYDTSGENKFVFLIKVHKPSGGIYNFAEENAFRIWIETLYEIKDML